MSSGSSLVGAAGEHYILSRLLRLGWVAALAPAGVPNTDIIVTDVEGKRQFAVQVKTRRDLGSDKGWHMRQKHEDISSPTLFYCFVDMGEGHESQPVTYIIPSSIVATVLKKSHQLWLNTPGKNGKPHNDTDMRRLLPDYKFRKQAQPSEEDIFKTGWMEKYKENWDIFSASS